MKRPLCLLLTAALLLVFLGGCNMNTTEQTPLAYAQLYAGGASATDAPQALHYAPDGCFGDVHPFYYDGKLYLYYLSTGKESDGSEMFSSKLAVSEDMIHFEPVPLVTDPDNPPEQELYFALGVYRDADGRFRSCYGKGSYVGGSVSDDLITWRNGAEPYLDEATGLLRYAWRVYFDSDVYSGRDPYICYDADTHTYYCVVMNYYSADTAAGAKGLALYTAGEDGKFSPTAEKLLSFTGRGDPECPQLMKIGERWYLCYSVYGSGAGGGVGRFSYRVGDAGKLPQEVDWEAAREYQLDGGDLHAAQLAEVGGRYYLYGWINSEPHSNVWGGYLNLPREVYQNEDGTLRSRCDEYLTALLKREQLAAFGADNTQCAGAAVSGSAFVSQGDGTVTLNGRWGRVLLTADLTLPAGAARSGITVESDGGAYFVGIVRQDGGLRLTVRSESGQAESAYLAMEDTGAAAFSVKVIVDGAFVEAFADDAYAVTAHTSLGAGEKTLGLSLRGDGAAADAVTVFSLADGNTIFNREE